MTSSVLRILAALVFLGAVFIGYIAWQEGQRPKETPVPVQVQPSGDAVVVAARNIAVGHAISAEDLATGHVPTRPKRAYGGNQDLIGKKPKILIAAGEMVLASHFTSVSQLAQSVHAGERAIAVKVDEVIGTGGFLEPGDRVDVLLYLRSDSDEIGENSSAQVVLSDIRLLSFGNILEPPVDKPAVENNPGKEVLNEAQKATPGLEKEEEKPTGKKSQTAVLAVPEKEVTKLMLAESSGKIRLALHGAVNEDEMKLAMAESPAAGQIPAHAPDKPSMENKNYFIELRELTKKAPAKAGVRAAGPRVVVHKGASRETVVPGR